MPDGFDIRWKHTEVLDGLETDVFEAMPKPVQDKTDKDGGAGNFKLTIWIDRAEAEIVKVEGKAIRSGILSPRPSYAVMDARNYSKEAAAKARQLLYDQSLRYSRGTVVIQKWTKINNDVWLPKRLYIKGREMLEQTVVLGTGEVGQGTAAFPVEHERTYSRYKKFRVDTRILPVKPQ